MNEWLIFCWAILSVNHRKNRSIRNGFFTDINPLTWICDMPFGRDIRLRRVICALTAREWIYITIYDFINLRQIENHIFLCYSIKMKSTNRELRRSLLWNT